MEHSKGLYIYICDWMLENQPNCHTGLFLFNLLTQLIATLIHYSFTMPLPGLTDWSAFLQ